MMYEVLCNNRLAGTFPTKESAEATTLAIADTLAILGAPSFTRVPGSGWWVQLLSGQTVELTVNEA